MPFWNRKKPDSPLLVNLERIGRIKNQLQDLHRGACNQLGLYAQFQQLSHTGVTVDTLQVGTQTTSYLDAWRVPDDAQWTVEKYHSGDWEDLVHPTIRLADWLVDQYDGGLSSQNEAIFSSLIEGFRKTGKLSFPEQPVNGVDGHSSDQCYFEDGTAIDTCNKCGGVFTHEEDHARVHLYSLPGPLASNILVINGRPTLSVSTGFNPLRDGKNADDDDELQDELDKVIEIQKGQITDGIHELPQDIEKFPKIASALRAITSRNFPNHVICPDCNLQYLDCECPE